MLHRARLGHRDEAKLAKFFAGILTTGQKQCLVVDYSIILYMSTTLELKMPCGVFDH